MATTRRRKSLNLIEQLESEPQRFDFFQAVRLLETAATLHPDEDETVADGRLVGLARPDQEAVHFSSRTSLAFNGSDVTKVSQKRIHSHDSEDNPALQWQMEVAMMGLSGSQGVMPFYLSEVVIAELRQKNRALKDYLDLFNHRTISMFYEAWQKYQVAPGYERAQRSDSEKKDLFTDALLSLSGLGIPELRYRSSMPDEPVAQFAGHFGRTICSAESLRSSIAGMFGLEIEIEQFNGSWYDLPEDARCRMPDEEHPHGINNCLGVNTVMGVRCYQAQSKFTVIAIPHSEEEFRALAPGSKTLEELKAFIRMSAGAEQDFDLEIRLCDKYFSMDNIFDPTKSEPLLGWNTYMNPELIDGDELSVRLSQHVPVPDDALPLAQ